MASMDFSTLDKNTKEELAERIALDVNALENMSIVLEHLFNQQFVIDEILRVRLDLTELVKDLGGHPLIN